MVYESAESAIASHDGTLMAQNNRSRIFFGPGEAGDEKNCKVKMAILPFFSHFVTFTFDFIVEIPVSNFKSHRFFEIIGFCDGL